MGELGIREAHRSDETGGSRERTRGVSSEMLGGGQKILKGGYLRGIGE